MRRILLLLVLLLPTRPSLAGPGESQLPLESQLPTQSPSFADVQAAPWRYIVIHHSASPSGNAASFDTMHRRKGWDGIAYHFVINNGKGGPDGRLEVTDRWWQQKHGAHAGALPANALPDERNEFNEMGIGICLVGNFEKSAPTKRQMQTLGKLLRSLRDKFDIVPDEVFGHRHVKQTACPGRYFPWKQVFAALGTPPQPLSRLALRRTYERCAWCLGVDTADAMKAQGGILASRFPTVVDESLFEPAKRSREERSRPPLSYSVEPGPSTPAGEMGTGFEPAQSDPTKNPGK